MILKLSILAYGVVRLKAFLAQEEREHKTKVDYSNFFQQREGLEEFRYARLINSKN